MKERSAWHSSWWIGAGAFILAAFVQTASSAWPDKIKPHPYAVGTFGMVGVLCIVVPVVQEFWSRIRSIVEPPPAQQSLQIIFEPLNPGQRFWSLEGHKDDLGRVYPPYWEHRVEVRNNSSKTIRNVMVTIEHTGQLPQLPVSPPFKRTETYKCDLNPGCSELVPVNRLQHPKRQEGMLASASAWAYGPIKVTASGDDTQAIVKMFEYNYETDQMLFDVEAYSHEDLHRITNSLDRGAKTAR